MITNTAYGADRYLASGVDSIDRIGSEGLRSDG